VAGLSVFAFYRNSPQRRAALARPVGSPERYQLFGLDELAARGVRVRHNLERGGRPARPYRVAARMSHSAVMRVGGYGGDFASVLPFVRAANSSDVVLSTVDTVGIPLLGLAALGLVRRPLVYVSIGLLWRLEPLRDHAIVRAYARVLRKAAAVVVYGAREADDLRAWLGGGNVVFVPFGVDVERFRPGDVRPDVDVVSVGADHRRDFDLLLRVAARNPSTSFRVVISSDWATQLGDVPANVEVEVDLPFDAMRDRLARARAVALPVAENPYSGATTVLLQALALGKPVVVSETSAIATGYSLEDGVNCRLVRPGDAEFFERALLDLLSDPGRAEAVSVSARATAERHLSWERYVESMQRLLEHAASID
jgi:glycosyltransferase involved in cell wall biosynthesis